MNINLQGKLALITGSSSGIGRAAALMLADAGAKVAVHFFQGRERGEDAVRIIRERGGEAALFHADVTSVQQINALMFDVQQTFSQPVDILVNNAGHLLERRINQEMTEDLYQQVMDLNVKSTIFACKAAVPDMIRKGSGTIINMASLAAHNGGGFGSSVYAASKAAVISYSKGLAKELAPYGIRVNIVAPGFIGDTDFHSKVTSAAERQKQVSQIPLQREGLPEDVAGAILFLASDLSGFITGETLEINGGVLMR